jgi:hypothetical protein
MSVSELGLNQILAKRVLPKASYHPLTRIERIDFSSVKLVHTATGKEKLLEGIDNTIMITSKPPEEALSHAMQGIGLEVQIIGDAREARWSALPPTRQSRTDGERRWRSDTANNANKVEERIAVVGPFLCGPAIWTPATTVVLAT